MCAIVGILGFSGTDYRVDDGLLVRMRDAMAHRGPDGAGAMISPDGCLGLGHRRLSIIDLSPSAGQPMASNDGQIQLVFNGEIYNHAEIRREIAALDPRPWQTDHSDTEVIIRAYDQWGIDCVHRFRGMFAIGLWDGRSRELWLVRDRIGIKPLYYVVRGDHLAFASEIKALLEDPAQPRTVDLNSLFHYLSFLTTPAPDTLFEGIRKLAGGCLMRVSDDGRIEERRYWDVWDHARRIDADEHELAALILSELRVSVKYRKVSDVPVGVFLSGGIDSSTNTALFSEGTGDVRTFSVGYEGDNPSYTNELEYARTMAKLVGADHHEVLLNVDDLINFVPTMVRLQDEPIADPVCVPVYYVSKLAREHGVTVCQVGEGADELFWGYPFWRRMLKLQWIAGLPGPKAAKRLGAALVGTWCGSGSVAHELACRASRGVPLFWGGAEAFTEFEKFRLLSPKLRRQFAGYSSYEAIRPIRERFVAKAWEPSWANWMSTIDLNLRLPELLLMRVDKMSMGVGLEGRVPFLDHKFVELVMGIPSGLKTGRGELKPLLKKAVRGLIPDELIDRRKQGFGIPMKEWYLGRLGGVIRKELADFCDRTDFFDADEVIRMVGARDGDKVWYLLNFALWWRQYMQA